MRIGRKGVRKVRLATRAQRRAICTNLGTRCVQLLAVGDHVLDLCAGNVQSFLVILLVLVPRWAVRVGQLVGDGLAREASCTEPTEDGVSERVAVRAEQRERVTSASVVQP